MLRDLKQIELKIDNYLGHFLVEHTTPITIAKEMCFQVLKILGQIEDNYKAELEAKAKAQAEAQSTDETKITPLEAQ